MSGTCVPGSRGIPKMIRHVTYFSLMKKPILWVLLLVVTGTAAQQAKFGVTAGYLNARGSIKAEEISISASESGFYGGLLADFTLGETWHVQPELLYATVDGGEALFLPIVLRYYVAPKLNFQAGPQFVFSLEDVPEDFTGVEFDLAGGIGFDITEDFFAQARYSFQLNNSYTGSEDVTVRGNYLTLGLGYTF